MFELIVAICLIALNGIFALSELAIVSARRARLRSMVENGRAGAASALALAEEPGRFLSTTQIGITLIGILAGAFSGAALGARLSEILEANGVRQAVADPVGFGVVISVITYLSVVMGELVPKQLALRHAETIACVTAPSMRFLSRAALPIVWLLDSSTRVVFRLFGQHNASANIVTDEEIRTIVAEAESAGVIETDERRMIAGVLRLGDRTVRGLLTPRTEVDRLDLDDDEADIRETLLTTQHSRLPVTSGDPDNVVGVVHVRDLLAALVAGQELDIRSRMRKAPIVPDTLDALEVMNVLRDADVPVAIVHDEYGHFEGIVTPADALGAIAGVFKSDVDVSGPDRVKRADGSWLLDGSMAFDEMAELIGLKKNENRQYETAAGFVIHAFERLPGVGEIVTAEGWRFEIVDLDGLRVDKILASREDLTGTARESAHGA